MSSRVDLVTVAIPVLNGANVIRRQLQALASQAYDGDWEVLVIDNGSTDASVSIVKTFEDALPSLRVVNEPRRGIGPSRNRALTEARGELLAICDCDDIVQPGWLSALVAASAFADVVGGTYDATITNAPLVAAWRGQPVTDRLPQGIGMWPFAPGGNCAVRVGAAKTIGGWDEEFAGGSDDVDFSWRLVQAGFRLGFAPGAVIAYTYRPGLKALIRQFWTYGQMEAKLFRKHLDNGLAPMTLREIAAVWRRIGPPLVLQVLRGDPASRGQALRELAYRAGRLRGAAREQVLFT